MEKNSTSWLKMRGKEKDSAGIEDRGRGEAMFFKEILDAMPDMVLKVDSDLRVVWANEAVLKIRSDVEDKPCYELFHQLDEPCDNCPCKRCIETGVVEKGVVALPAREGVGVTYWENMGIPVKDSRGIVVAAIEISRDVTDRIHSGYEIQQLSEHMDSEINRYKEELNKRLNFIHKLADEVRSDIEDMSDQLSFLHHRPEFKNAEWVGPMIELNEKTLRRMGNLGDLFSLEEAPLQLVYVPFEVTELVDEVYNRFKQRAKEKNIGLEVHVARTMPKKLIGDVFRINAVLMNILENSLTHTQNGSIKVYFYGMGKSESGFMQLQIIISDTGMGLTEEKLGKIQLLLKEESGKHTLDQAMEMQGLGLLMAHNTLKAMQGYLELESQYGRGTQVKLNFSMGVRSEKTEHKNREMVHEDTEEIEIRREERKRILIAEDEVVARVTYKIHLQDQYDLIFAKNGKEAVDLYLSEKPDLVFMDIMMPVLNGLEAFDEIEKYRRRQVPIVACTAKVIDSEREYLMTYGFSDYLPKPVDPGQLIRLVTKHIK